MSVLGPREVAAQTGPQVVVYMAVACLWDSSRLPCLLPDLCFGLLWSTEQREMPPCYSSSHGGLELWEPEFPTGCCSEQKRAGDKEVGLSLAEWTVPCPCAPILGVLTLHSLLAPFRAATGSAWTLLVVSGSHTPSCCPKALWRNVCDGISFPQQ